MKKRGEKVFSLATFITFLILEAAAAGLMLSNGVVQRFRLMGSLRQAQAFFWERNSRLGRFLNLRTENERLAEENLALKNELSRYRTFLAESDTLAGLSSPEFTFIKARVVKSFTDRQYNYITIDRGTDNGVRIGMGVVTEKGIAGIVSATGRKYSQIISFMSKDQTVSARILKNGAFGPMNWIGADTRSAMMHQVSVHADAAPGDTVVSSGFSSIYPPDIPLGVITGSEILNGSYKELSVNLFEDYGALSTVYVAVSSRADEINEVRKVLK